MNIKILLLTSFVLTATILFSQNNTDNLLPYKQGNKFVFCNTDAKQQIKTTFEYAEPFRNGFAIIGNNNLLGVIDEKGKEIIPIKYWKIDYAFSSEQETSNNDRGLYFSVNGNSIYYSVTGNQIQIKPNENEEYDFEFSFDYKIININNKFGFVEFRDTLIQPIYDHISLPTDGFTILIAKKGDHFGIITTENEIIVPFKYSEITWDKKNIIFILKKEDPPETCFFVFHGYPTKYKNTFCGYKKIVNKRSGKYMLVTNSKNSTFYINIRTGKELVKH